MPKFPRLVKKITDVLEDHKGVDIVVIDLRKIENSFCSFFVICNGTSNTHVSSMAEAVEDDVLEDLREKPYHTEGKNLAQWVILDYGDTIVHIFQKEQRDFYQLEEFWGDGIQTEIKETAATVK